MKDYDFGMLLQGMRNRHTTRCPWCSGWLYHGDYNTAVSYAKHMIRHAEKMFGWKPYLLTQAQCDALMQEAVKLDTEKALGHLRYPTREEIDRFLDGALTQ